MENLSKEESLDALINDSVVMILQFGAVTCAPCKSIKQRIDLWSADHKSVKSRYIDIEEFPIIAEEHGIYSAPAILVFVEGKLTVRKAGYFSLDEVFMQIERYLGMLEE